MTNTQKSLPERISQAASDHMEKLITAGILLIGTTILQSWSERIFDAAVALMGKRILLEIAVITLCALGYYIFLAVSKSADRLRHHRGLYWSRRDPVPFCPVCYDKSGTKARLFKGSHIDPALEVYECHNCFNDLMARDGRDFRPRFNNLRAAMNK